MGQIAMDLRRHSFFPLPQEPRVTARGFAFLRRCFSAGAARPKEKRAKKGFVHALAASGMHRSFASLAITNAVASYTVTAVRFSMGTNSRTPCPM